MGKKHENTATEEQPIPADPKNKKDKKGEQAELERAEEETEEAPPSEQEGQQRSRSTSDDRSSDPVVNSTANDTFLGEGVNEDEHPTGGL